MFFQIAGEKPTIQPETIFHIADFPVTNAMITAVLVTLLLFWLAIYVSKKSKIKNGVPSKFQIILEILVEAFIGLLSQITGNKKRAMGILPLIGTLFLFIGISNLITLIPGFSAMSFDGLPLFRTPTNDFNTTFTIALAMVILTQIVSIQHIGVLSHLGKYFKFKEVFIGFKQGIGAGSIAIIDFLIGLLDIISEIAKVVSLSLRLFGNMYAGDMLTMVLFSALAVLAPTPWLAMNILTGVLQAMVFGSLTAAYYSSMVEGVDEENSDEAKETVVVSNAILEGQKS